MKTFRINGIELATVDRGAGPPVVLLHGFPLDHTMWNAQVEALSQHYRVLAPDLRGFGRSETGDAKVTMEQFADDVAALLDAAGVAGPITLAGLSMGGYVAWQFWRKHTHRLRALLLCDTRATADTAEAAAGRLDTAQRVLREGPGPLVDTMIPKLFAETTLEKDPGLIESVRRVMLSTSPAGIAAAARAVAERPDVTAWLDHIACPTLVLVGRLDRISTPDEMRSIALAIPGARFVEIAGAGHMAPLENPSAANAAMLDFLTGAI